MSLFSRITNKLRRRTRVKGTQRLQAPMDNAAKRLIDSFYGMGYSPKRAGISPAVKRAQIRLANHRSQWAKTPDCSAMTRQRIRASQRAAVKRGEVAF